MRYRAVVSYYGKHYVGWQRQLNGPSVQEALEKALQEGAQRGVLVCGSLYLAGEARPLLKKLLNPA